ncbi:acyltransferase [Lysobacter hankyongensis]|uniref:Acyltransferase n=1 Tax=Lysobacter hankyongensis TaxID=1176535 RepID=A0ABP9BYF6_9GAMM
MEQGSTVDAARIAANDASAREDTGPGNGGTTGSTSGGGARVGELDALRGLAALGVVVFHYTTFYQQEQGHLQPLGFGFPAGNYGVHLFFLISGFVIFMTLERTRTAMDFVVSRFSRLFPAYWAAMAITAAVVYTIGLPGQRIAGPDLFANLSMLQEILGFDHLDGSYWTLQVELFFYAQMLFWFVLGQLDRIRWIILFWLAMTVAYALTAKNHVHFSYTVRETMILRHIPFFAIGILFYKRHVRSGDARVDIALILLALAAIGVSFAPEYFVAGVVCCAVFALFVGGRLRWLRAAPFAFLGGISYSLYLLHQAIGFAAIHRLEAAGVPSLVAMALAIALALVLATALTLAVERPAMRMLRQGWRTRGRPAAG